MTNTNLRYAGQQARELLKERNLKHVIYGVGNQITDWKTKMWKCETDEQFDECIKELQHDFPNQIIYAVHSF